MKYFDQFFRKPPASPILYPFFFFFLQKLLKGITLNSRKDAFDCTIKLKTCSVL